jgi:hypothetical protein
MHPDHIEDRAPRLRQRAVERIDTGCVIRPKVIDRRSLMSEQTRAPGVTAWTSPTEATPTRMNLRLVLISAPVKPASLL